MKHERLRELSAATGLPPVYLSALALGCVALALGLALLPAAVLAAGCGLLLALALPLIDPVFGVYLTVLSVPLQQLVVLPGGLSYTQAAALLMLGGWGLRTLARPQERTADGRVATLWLFVLWSLLLAACFTPYSTSESVKAMLRWTVAFSVWLVAVQSIARPWQRWGLVACLLLAPAADAALGIVQFFSGAGPASFRVVASQPFVRAYGSIGQPNSFAGYLNMAWPLALALAAGWRIWRGAGILAGLGLGVLAAVLLAGLGLSFSLGGWIGAAVGVLGLALALGGRWARAALAGVVLLALFLGLGGAGLLPGPVAARLTRLTGNLALFDPSTVTVTPENFAVVERMAQMWAGWRMFLGHPLTGIGPGNYTNAYADVAAAPWYASRGHAHNFYLHMAAEAGAIGLAAYLMLIIGVCYQAAAGLRRAHTAADRSILIGCCGIIAAVAGHDMFENLHVLNLGVQLASVWALINLVQGGRHDQAARAPVTARRH